MENNKNTPEIRFPGFAEAWEQRKLGDVLSFVKDGTHGTHPDASEGPLLLSAKNIKNGCINWDESDRRISQQEYKKIHSTFNLMSGDVLMTIVGSIGEAAILKEPENITFQRSVAFLRPNENITSEFLYSEIQTSRFQKDLDSRKSTSAQPGIYLGDLSEMPFSYPSDIHEQKQIGSLILKMENAITLHQRKCDELKMYKKGLLQMMFPQPGDSFPRLRFPGFDDPWEQRKLEDMCTLITKQTGFDYSSTIKPSLITEKQDDTYSFIQNKDFEGLNINFDTDFYIPISVAEKYPKITLDQPSLLISISGRIGNVGLYLNESKAFIGGAVGICKLKDAEEGEVALYELLSPSGQLYFSSLIKASSHANITVEDIRKITLLLPKSRDEILMLNHLFRDLNNLITLHQRKCDELKMYKKGLLQKMFV